MTVKTGSTQALADYLVSGYWLGKGTIPHSFGVTQLTFSTAELSAEAQALVRASFQAWSSVSGLAFQEVTTGARITFHDDTVGAGTTASYTSDGATESADVYVGTDWLAAYGTTVGSYSFLTFLHEIGHALGLGHAGPYDGSASFGRDALFAIDSWQHSVMSYFNQVQATGGTVTWAVPVTPMMADILAIQKLYGVPVGGPTAGDTTWGIGSNLGTYLDAVFQGPRAGLVDRAMTIYDEGGLDTLCFSNDARNQRVDLNAGAFSDVYGERGNLGIAVGTTIENYVAGSGSDQVHGNAAANTITLGKGNDKAFGGAGADRILGGDGNDWLDGGAGADILTGGQGQDHFVFNGGQDMVMDFRNNVDTIVLDDALWGRHLSVRQVLGSFARVNDGDVVFDFGHGSVLRIEGLNNSRHLLDDLVIV